MASFQNVRDYEPSAYAEGFSTFSSSLPDRGLFHAAARTASAHSELATLRGPDAVHSTPEPLTGTHRASQPLASLVRASATTRDIPGRRVA